MTLNPPGHSLEYYIVKCSGLPQASLQARPIAMDLFEAVSNQYSVRPLAERLRPRDLTDVIGQEAVLKILKPFLPDKLPNLILWGPPGSGKTTLARILAEQSKSHFINLNAVATGSKEIRELGERAHLRKIQGLGQTLIFIDEIHRLNRGQQDVLLPFTESGDFTLIGATTENPSYELNSALLSRTRVLTLSSLTTDQLRAITHRGLIELGVSELSQAFASKDAFEALLAFSDGDARKLLTALETLAVYFAQGPLDKDQLAELLQKPSLRYDKTRDEHYDTISAFIKSVRGSDADAAIYYLARMLKGGEDPVFIARRLVILASEDIGNADPRALSTAVSGLQAVELVGMPEGAINLAQVTTYLASAPKSNASYVAIKKAQALVEQTGTLPIPKSLRSAQTKLAKQLGHGEGYRYAHDGETGWQDMQFLPDAIQDQIFYEPVDRGFEKTIRQYLQWMKQKPKADS